ncbi:hypothetical protein L1987_08550 [Smallanthus sonchifolius]|uniref:Uncharacterized protein n=1 Tax=Smallanthus sonchifolius TaxID=185202 RepID=A0ACB9JKZ4_9ASTR|nr:hypothetical protein L1987_08550 [Smallanthus sonchifolius]
MHGEEGTPCMGKGKGQNDVTRPNGINSIFFFESAEKSQEKGPEPNPWGATLLTWTDLFLDLILRPNSSPVVLPQPLSQVNLSPQIPDLNSIMGGSSSAGTDDISIDSHVSDTHGTATGRLVGSEEAALNKEVEATIGMGKELGVNLDNFEDLVRMEIEGEMVPKVDQ